MNQKLIIADQMGKKSVEQRQFLGDIAELLPDVDSGSRFFIDATKLPRTAKGTIVRPDSTIVRKATILLRYLYRDKKISAISNTTYRSEKGWVYYNPENKTIYEKKKNRFPTRDLIILKYIPGAGVELAKSAVVRTKNGAEVQIVSDYAGSGPSYEVSSRVDWFQQFSRKNKDR